jgi:hypothetical protein
MIRIFNHSVLLISCGLLFSCFSEEKKAAITEGPVYTLVFMDKTQSVNVNKAFVAQKYQQSVFYS